MPDLAFLGTGAAFPFQFSERLGGVSTSDTQAHVEQSMLQILSTMPGERMERPDFGCRLRELCFEKNTDVLKALATHHIKTSLAQWEKRVVVLGVNFQDDTSGNGILIQIPYRTIDGQVSGNLVYPFAREA